MRFTVLACDYDGTIAQDGRVEDEMAWDLGRVRTSGRNLILVTGRDLPTLRSVCPHLELFDRVIAENGALLYRPEDGSERLLADAPPDALVERLRAGGVPVDVGRVVVFTWKPNEVAALEAIADLGLGHQVIMNRQAVMVVPPGVTKGTAIMAALDELRMSPHNTVAVGDAENDHDLLAAAECGVAVGDAVPALADRADYVTEAPGPEGTRELIAAMLDDDLTSWDVGARPVLIGHDDGGGDVGWSPAESSLLITGGSGSGKSTLVSALVEQLIAARYETVVVDPEGDFEDLPGAITVGGPQSAPSVDEIANLVEEGTIATVVTLVAVPMEDRPRVIREVLTRLVEVEERLGRPHAVVLDEAHHAFPADAPVDAGVLPPGLVLVSNTPRGLQRDLFDRLESVVAVGDDARAMLEQVAEAIGARLSVGDAAGEAVAWRLDEGHVRWFTPVSARHRRRRHSAKMLSGDVGEGERLVVTGPEGTLSLEVRNLSELVRIAEGVDDATWWHHLSEGDWSRWVRDVIGDADLADAIETFAAKDLDPAAGRRALREEVGVRYPGLDEA
jgi:hydroxymethylpyrimidine pyrophosphatase-like HAD family hydrolase/energy-coupling factor transporter ATP-binding protein EcfA2